MFHVSLKKKKKNIYNTNKGKKITFFFCRNVDLKKNCLMTWSRTRVIALEYSCVRYILVGNPHGRGFPPLQLLPEVFREAGDIIKYFRR